MRKHMPHPHTQRTAIATGDGTIIHLSRDEREMLAKALMDFKASNEEEAETTPDLCEYLQIENGEADALAVKLDLVGDYYVLERETHGGRLRAKQRAKRSGGGR